MAKHLLSTAALLFVIGSAWGEEPKTEPLHAPAPVPAFSRAQSPAWVALIDRLRVQPRAGEISNGPIKAFITDFFADKGPSEAKALALVADYEKDVAELGAKFERELKQRRAGYEAKMILELPEAQREQAAKFLALSRAKWDAATEHDAKAREEFLEEIRRTAVTPKNPQEHSVDTGYKIQAEFEKTRRRDEEDVKALRELLGPEAAARLDQFAKNRGYVPYKPPQK